MIIEMGKCHVPGPGDLRWVEYQNLGAEWLDYDSSGTRAVSAFLPPEVSWSRSHLLSAAGQILRGEGYVYLWDLEGRLQEDEVWELVRSTTEGCLFRRPVHRGGWAAHSKPTVRPERLSTG